MNNKMISDKYQLIDDESIFNFDELNGLNKQIVKQFGKDYRIVSIIGSQSSGKSTLLNTIFNTQFEVLNRKKRVQKASGIVLIYHLNLSYQMFKVLILTKDKKELQFLIINQKIQRRNSLFALSISHTLLINLSIKQIGLYKGSQLAILEIILQLNLKLFGGQKPKQIFFVVRDYMNKQQNQQVLKKNLFLKVEQIWNSLHKPLGKEYIKLNEVFNFKAFFLPSKIQEKQQFIEGVDQLKKQLLKNSYKQEFQKYNIPMKDFPIYMKNLWNIIELDQDINLPNEKILLSKMKCQQIKTQIYQKFQLQFIDEIEKSQRVINQNFCKNIKVIVKKIINSYDKQTDCYIKEEADKIKQEFIHFLQRKIQESFSYQVKMISKECFRQFVQRINKTFLKQKNIESIKSIKPQIIKIFEDLINNICYKQEWKICEKQKFILFIDQSFEQQKQKIIFQSLKDFDRMIKKQIQGLVSYAFYDKKIFCESFWKYINKGFKDIQIKSKNSILAIYSKLEIRQKGNQPINKVISQFINKAHYNAEQQLKTIIQIRSNDLLYYIMRHFSVEFNMNQKQIPRQWADMKSEQITILFEKCKSKFMKLIDNFRSYELKFDLDEQKINLLEQKKILSRKSMGTSLIHSGSGSDQLLKNKNIMLLTKKLQEQMKNSLEQALKKNKQVYMGSIPTWGWIVFLLVAFDDILLWLHSPYLAIPLTLILIAVAAVFMFGGKSTAGNIVNTARKGATTLMSNVTARAASQMLKKD